MGGRSRVALSLVANQLDEKETTMKRLTVLLTALTCLFAPASIASATRWAHVAAAPTCIVSLSPSATESLYAIGAGSQVQAVDSDSNYPTKGLPSKRIDPFSPSIEGISSVCKVTTVTVKGKKVITHSSKPDLVVIAYDPGGLSSGLRALGISVIVQDAPTTVSAALAQIRQLGSLSGHAATATALATSMQNQITKDIKSMPAHSTQGISAFYEIDPTLYSLTSSTFAGSLLASLGVANIADAVDSPDDAGYPQLQSEYIISSSPKIIFTADGTSVAAVSARTGWKSISAVAKKKVFVLNQDIASRWGPRLVLLMDTLTADVKSTVKK